MILVPVLFKSKKAVFSILRAFREESLFLRGKHVPSLSMFCSSFFFNLFCDGKTEKCSGRDFATLR